MRGGRSQNNGAVLADEGIENFLVGFAGGDAGAQLASSPRSLGSPRGCTRPEFERSRRCT
jgi:fructose-1-phosphate kinase PfkB-like protein